MENAEQERCCDVCDHQVTTADMQPEISCILKAVTEYLGKGEKKVCTFTQ